MDVIAIDMDNDGDIDVLSAAQYYNVLSLFENNMRPDLNASICQGDSYVFGTQTLDSAGPYTEIYTTLYGCDSTVLLNLDIIPLTDTITWEGSYNNDWHELSNWLPCLDRLPDSTNIVIVPGNTNSLPYISNGMTGECHEIIIYSDDSAKVNIEGVLKIWKP